MENSIFFGATPNFSAQQPVVFGYAVPDHGTYLAAVPIDTFVAFVLGAFAGIVFCVVAQKTT